MRSIQHLAHAGFLLSACVNGQAIAPVGPTSYSNAPTVDLGYVKYLGYTNATAGINYFRGIQYASLIDSTRL